MSEDYLDSLTEMLRTIQKQGHPDSEPDVPDVPDVLSGMSPEEKAELLVKSANIRREAQQDPKYAFTEEVIETALFNMIPLMSAGKPFEGLMDELGLSSYLIKRNLVHSLLTALKQLPEDMTKRIMENVDYGADLLALLTYVFIEAVFLADTAKELKAQKKG